MKSLYRDGILSQSALVGFWSSFLHHTTMVSLPQPARASSTTTRTSSQAYNICTPQQSAVSNKPYKYGMTFAVNITVLVFNKTSWSSWFGSTEVVKGVHMRINQKEVLKCNFIIGVTANRCCIFSLFLSCSSSIKQLPIVLWRKMAQRHLIYHRSIFIFSAVVFLFSSGCSR